MREFVLVVTLSLCLLTTCICQEESYGANYSPTVGSVIVDYPETNANYTFNCDQFRNSQGSITQVTTFWSLENFLDLGLVSISATHPEFVISGTKRNGSIPFPTFRNELTIVSLTQRLHNVRLYCGHDSLDAHWDLRVYSAPVLNDVQLSIAEGGNVSVDLSVGRVAAFPFPTEFMWRKDGQSVVNSSAMMYVYPTLTLTSITRGDAGVYTLIATSYELGDQQSVIVGTGNGTIHLDVYYGPEVDNVSDSSTVGVEDTNVTLVCATSLVGNPLPIVQWRNNVGSVIDSTDTRYTLSDDPEIVSLIITGALINDSGNWTCSLTNNQTGVSLVRTVLLTVLAVPSAPVNVSVQAVGPTWLNVRWATEPDTDTMFNVTATPQHVGLVSVRTESMEANVTGLNPGTAYTVNVFAITTLEGVMATSQGSIQIVVETNTTVMLTMTHTQQATLSCTRTVPEVECVNTASADGVAMVTWDYVHTGGLNLTDLTVEYSSSGQPDFLSLTSNLSDTLLNTLQVGGLTAGVPYTFRIRASNNLGYGQVVCPALWHSTGIPQTPVILRALSDNPLEVVLSVSTQATGTLSDDPSFEFLIQVQNINSSLLLTFASPAYVDDTVLDLRVTSGLVAGKVMWFEVGARNQYGSTPFSQSVQVTVMDISAIAQEIPVAAVAGGSVGGVVVLVLLLLVIIVAGCIIRNNKRAVNKDVRSDSMEMISNQNYGKCGTTSEVDAPQYEAIPLNISRSASQKSFDHLAPSTEKTSANPLYSSTGELRMSGLFNSYDVLPVRSKGNSRSNSPALNARGQSISQSPLPPRPKSQTTHHIPSYPVYSTPAVAMKDNVPHGEHYLGFYASSSRPTEPVYSEL